MKLSCRWLDELVGLGGRDPAEIARLVTFHTAQVEAIEEIGGGLDGVVTGKVLGVRPHPQADRLRLCTVDRGTDESIEVVCGAPNVAEGQMICFAPVGVTLPNGVKLKRAKIRGVESCGMICALDELGLGEDHTGIIVLPPDTPIGIPVAEAMQVRDSVLEVDNHDLTHRPDLWGHVGFARELGAILDEEFNAPGTPRADAVLEAAEKKAFRIDIEDPEGCRRYLGIVVENVTNGPSPAPIRHRLEALGMRSIDLLVDLTNLVMLEQGQPLHAFDLRDLQRDRIVVRAARPGETMNTLDGEARKLHPEDLVIADGDRAVAIAGVMGGENSEVRADTRSILLEAANFDAVRVRRTASRLGLRTEASSRFEKSLDPVLAKTGAKRFLELLLEHCPQATVARRMADAYPRPYPPISLQLPFGFVAKRLGSPVTHMEVRRNLTALGFDVKEIREGFQVDVPSWRATKDIDCAEDLVEEVGRIHGYTDIATTAPVGALTPMRPPPLRRLERHLSAVLSLDLGYAEMMAYAFYGPKDAEWVGLADTPHLHIRNPLTEDQDRMCLTATPGLLRRAARNVVATPAGRLWESTRLVVPRPEVAPEGLPTEIRVYAAVAWDAQAGDDPDGTLFLSVVQDVRSLLEAAPVSMFTIRDAGDTPVAEGLPIPVWLHPGRRAVFEVGGHVLAVVGEVAPGVVRAYDLPGRAVVAEVAIDVVLASLDAKGTGYRSLHRYPVVPFDVAVFVPQRTPAAAVEAAIAGVSDSAVRAVRLFDVYEGEGVPDGQRSLAFACELLDPKGTLDTKKADTLRGRILRALEAEGWTVRTGA